MGASMAMDTSLEEIAACAQAQANVVVSQSGLAAANDLYSRLGIPYVAGLPVGKKPTEELLELLGRTCADGKNRIAASEKPGKKVLILGEKVISDSIRRCLVRDYGFEGVTVAGLFTPNAGLMQPGDMQAACEEEIAAEVNGGYDIVIGDPMLKVLLEPGSRTKFVDFPNPAVSSKLHWNECIPFIGEHIEELVKRI